MKKIILFTAILIGLSLSAQNPPNYSTITDVTFTDVDGQTHNLYNLLGRNTLALKFGINMDQMGTIPYGCFTLKLTTILMNMLSSTTLI